MTPIAPFDPYHFAIAMFSTMLFCLQYCPYHFKFSSPRHPLCSAIAFISLWFTLVDNTVLYNT
ncbi:hypothetical protein HYDPIDRAFT_110773 [Hydnomerulius pinastri MD-312]|nr:hypothetical protein HYDPIDRAFT_110773 [Hydnomerulius pinastri MD-312]